MLNANSDAQKKYGVLGVPWDQGATHGRPGSRFAPETVRKNAQWILDRVIDNEILDVEAWRVLDLNDLEIKDFGDMEIIAYDYDATYQREEETLKDIIKGGYTPVVIGGDCSVAYPLIKAIHDSTEGNVGIIHFDGHFDLLDSTPTQGKFSHSSPIRRAMELPRVKSENVVQLGVRCFNFPFYYKFVEENNITEISPRNFYELGIEGAAEKMLQVAGKGTDRIVLAIDIDVLDGVYSPGSGANEPGGFTTYEIQEVVKLLAPYVSAFDVTEINPAFDFNDFSSIAGAKLLFDYIFNHYEPEKKILG